MKRGVLAAIVLLIAATAQAQAQAPVPGATGAAVQGGLRGAQTTQSPAAPVDPLALPAPALFTAPPAPLMSPVDQARGQCAAVCARAYYFCLAGEDADFCPSSWSQCTAACSQTSRRAGP